jgi:hypothetical protein
MNCLPEYVLQRIIQLLPKSERWKLLLLSKKLSPRIAIDMYTQPQLLEEDSFEQLSSLIAHPGLHEYEKFITILDIQSAAAANMLLPVNNRYMGDLDVVLRKCINLKVFKLRNCLHASNILLQSLSNCIELEELDLLGYSCSY